MVDPFCAQRTRSPGSQLIEVCARAHNQPRQPASRVRGSCEQLFSESGQSCGERLKGLLLAVSVSEHCGAIQERWSQLSTFLDAVERTDDASPQLLVRPDKPHPESVQFFLKLDLLCVVGIPFSVPAAEVMPDLRSTETLLRFRRDQDMIRCPVGGFTGRFWGDGHGHWQGEDLSIGAMSGDPPGQDTVGTARHEGQTAPPAIQGGGVGGIWCSRAGLTARMSVPA